MKQDKQIFWLSLMVCLFLGYGSALGAPLNISTPPVIQKGFALYASGGIEPAFEAWRKGSATEPDTQVSIQKQNLKRMASNLGNYKSYEVINAKAIGSHSRIFYISMLFERGAVFSSFLTYNPAGSDWIIQRMVFSTAPEKVVAWPIVKEEENEERDSAHP